MRLVSTLVVALCFVSLVAGAQVDQKDKWYPQQGMQQQPMQQMRFQQQYQQQQQMQAPKVFNVGGMMVTSREYQLLATGTVTLDQLRFQKASKQFASVPASSDLPANPLDFVRERSTFNNALNTVAGGGTPRFREDPVPPPSPNNEAANAESGAAIANPAAGATSKEEAEAACSQAAAVGGITEAEGEDPAAQEESGGPSAPPVTADQPSILMPDGTKLPLPIGCSPLEPKNLTPDSPSSPLAPEDWIPPGTMPCQACPGDEPPPPVREIQILEWAPGRVQPIVLGKQLLTPNKTELMVQVVSGEWEKKLAEEKKQELNIENELNESKMQQQEIAHEYANKVLMSAEHSQNQAIEDALSQALGIWGLESTHGKPKPPEPGPLTGVAAPEGALTEEEKAAVEGEAEQEEEAVS